MQKPELLDLRPVWVARRLPAFFVILAGLLLFVLGALLFLGVEQDVQAKGVLAPERELQVRARASGILVGVRVRTSEAVRKDQVLGQIDYPPEEEIARSRLDGKKSSLRVRLLKKQIAEAKTLMAQGFSGAYELNQLALQLSDARADAGIKQEEVALLLRQRRESLLLAPVRGLITTPEVETLEGKFYRQGDTVFTVAEESGFRVKLQIDQKDAPLIAGGQGVELKIPQADGVVVYKGKIVSIQPSLQINPSQDVRQLSASRDAGLMQPKPVSPFLVAYATLLSEPGSLRKGADPFLSGMLIDATIHCGRVPLWKLLSRLRASP